MVDRVVEVPVEIEKIIYQPVEKVVFKEIERVVERPVDRIIIKEVEKIIERPIITEKIVEKFI